MRLYKTILCDPPWRYAGASNGKAVTPYPTMTLGEMVEMQVIDFAEDDCHLWLWATNAMMEEAHRLQRAWGFRPVTIVTWCKPGPGVGHYVRNNTEHLLLGSRGRPMTPDTKALSSWYQWPRGKHSVKPDAAYDLIEQISPAPRLEVFARGQQRLGWHTWGNEAFCHVDMPMSAPPGRLTEAGIRVGAESTS